MHILYFHQHFSTPQGAAGTRSYEMAKAILRAGHSVTVVCGSYAQGETGLISPFRNGRRRGVVEGIEIIELDIEYGNHLGPVKRAAVFAQYAIGAIGIALSEPTDLIFATTTPLTAGIPGICAKVFRQKPFVFEVRDLWPELPKAMGVITNPIILGLMGCLELVSYRSADRLIGLSPGIVDGICARGVASRCVAMIPNGCDLELFKTETEKWRPEGVDDSDILAIFTGTHGVANGLGAVLDAAEVLKQRGSHKIKIALVGQGREKNVLIKKARLLDLDNVLFLDPVSKNDLTRLMAGADIGLQVLCNVPAFYYGTSPNKFFDYIAAGLPVINNYPGWIAELIEDNSCGYAVEPDNPAALANALEQAACDQKTLVQKGVNARNLANRCFDRRELASQWINWVVGMVNKTG